MKTNNFVSILLTKQLEPIYLNTAEAKDQIIALSKLVIEAVFKKLKYISNDRLVASYLEFRISFRWDMLESSGLFHCAKQICIL